jgi:hypothetical protein
MILKYKFFKTTDNNLKITFNQLKIFNKMGNV